MVLLLAVSKVELLLSINKALRCSDFTGPDNYSTQGVGGARSIVQAGPCI